MYIHTQQSIFVSYFTVVCAVCACVGVAKTHTAFGRSEQHSGKFGIGVETCERRI
jgi:hypothetical protein